MAKGKNIKKYIYLTASILLGLIFLASGSGKLIGIEETPAQIIDFMVSILPDALMVPATLFFLFNILIPYIIPIAEFLFGLFLLIGFVPRLISLLCVLLTATFIATNIWAITGGEYATCASCFGIWEHIFGHLTPVQSLVIDIIMVLLAILIIILHEGSFLSSRKRLTNIIRNDISPLFNRIKLFFKRRTACVNNSVLLTRTRKFIRRHRKVFVGCGIVLLCVVVVLAGIGIYRAADNFHQSQQISSCISNVAISEITEQSAKISVTSVRPCVIEVVVYYNDMEINMFSSDIPDTNHQISVSGLSPSTEYTLHFKAAERPEQKKQALATTISLVTADIKPAIFNIEIDIETDTSVIISWHTSRQATSELEYWPLKSNDKKSVTDNELKERHQFMVDGLLPGEIYYYSIFAVDEHGNKGSYAKGAVFSTSYGTVMGKKAPEFELPSLDGEDIRLSQYQGKTVVLTFWMTTCGACRLEMPMIQQASKVLPRDRVVFLNVHMGLRESVIRGFLVGEGLDTDNILLDLDRQMLSLYNFSGVPYTFIIDGSGFIQSRNLHFSSAEELIQIVNSYIEDDID